MNFALVIALVNKEVSGVAVISVQCDLLFLDLEHELVQSVLLPFVQSGKLAAHKIIRDPDDPTREPFEVAPTAPAQADLYDLTR